MQAWTAWRRSARELRARRAWFLGFGIASQFFYTELKNVVNRTAHLKEAMRKRQWKVTPRPVRFGIRAPEPARLRLTTGDRR